MAMIEGFRVRNYRALRDVTLGKLSTQQKGDPLTPFTVVIGKNGVGKSTLFDAFGFVSDCLSFDVEAACDMKQRGGFERMRSLGTNEAMQFEIYYREASGERPITYELAIDLDQGGRPYVQSELLKQRRKGQKHGRPFPFLRLDHNKGKVWAGIDNPKLALQSRYDNSAFKSAFSACRSLGATVRAGSYGQAFYARIGGAAWCWQVHTGGGAAGGLARGLAGGANGRLSPFQYRTCQTGSSGPKGCARHI